MLWFLTHNFMQLFDTMQNQTKNLTTFLFGTTIYTLFYSYLGSLNFEENLFFKSFFNFFFYIILADAFAMAIIYKNYYKTTIFTEINETLGDKLTEKKDV
jgi:hypothetical protein